MEQKPESGVDEDQQRSRIRLYLAVSSVNLLYVCAGTVAAWTSPTLPKLANQLTDNESSLIGSLFSLGAAFGPILSAFCLDSIGRKGVLNILGICYAISWVMLAVSTNVYVIYLARIIGGVGVGGSFSCASLYIAEIADNKTRSTLGSLNIASVAIGYLIEYCIGPWTGYLTLILISLIPCILFMITFFYIPESPYYLLIKDRKEEAVDSLRWFRGNVEPHAVQQEFTNIADTVQFNKDKSYGFKAGIKALFTSGPLRALIISVHLLILQQACGGNAIFTFAEQIFELGHVAVSGSGCAIIGGVTVFLASIATPFIVHKFSMKKALLGSSFGVSLTLGLLALYFYLQSIGYANISKISFLPVLAFILYNVLFCWGCGPVPWPIVAELFPLEVKGIAICICGIISSLAGFAVISLAGIFIPTEGPAVVFAGFGIYVILGAFVSIYVTPDTTGMSLQEIHEYMASGQRPERLIKTPRI